MKQKIEESTAKLSKAETDCHKFEKRGDHAEGQVSLLEVRVAELRTDNKRLIGQCDKLAAKIENLHEELLKTTQEKADASARLEEMAKSLTVQQEE